MEKPHQFQSRKQWEEFIWQKILNELTHSDSIDRTGYFLDSIIGEYEKNLIIRRITAILLLQEGLSYREIGEILWVSPNTISTIRKSINSKTRYKSYKKSKPVKPAHIQDEEFIYHDSKNDFIPRLERFVEAILKGKSDPKYRWRFLRE